MQTLDVSTLATLIGVALAITTFFIGRTTASKGDGKESGSMKSDIQHIKSSLDRIESQLSDDIHRLEGRVDEISCQHTAQVAEMVRIDASTRSAHKRLDDHLKGE